jgi:hypothetical protein
MSRPEPRLVTKILSLEAVKAAGISEVFPLKIPQNKSYPGVVYQLLSDTPIDDSMGRAAGHQARIRIACLARQSSGVAGYAAAKNLAAAIEGDSNPDMSKTPSGIAGWRDTEGNVWVKERSFDELGTIISGTDEFEAYAINLIVLTAYSNLLES